VGLLARAAARTGDPRTRADDADPRQEADPDSRLVGDCDDHEPDRRCPVDVDAEGFLTDPGQWNETIASAIALENGIPELTDRHRLVVRFMRERYLATGTAPSIRALGQESGVPIKELCQLGRPP
jgi:TusE/DsrC/DsvC family sulfur relay protein